MSQTGPITPEGKKRSSLNALKHGLNAQSAHAMDLIDSRCGVDYETTLRRMTNQFQPSDALEEDLVRRIARCMWRLERSAAMEESLIARMPDRDRPSVSHDKILKFERLVDIHLHRAIAALFRKKSLGNILTHKTKSDPSSNHA